MNFIVGLPCTCRQNDSLCVIVDKLKKSGHFIPVKTSYSVEVYARLYLKEIVSLHEIPLYIILDEGSQVTSHF